MDLVPPRPVTISSPVAPPEKHKRLLIVPFVLVILLVLGAIFFYPPLRNSVQQVWDTLFFPKELTALRFIADKNGTSVLYARSGNEFVPYTITDGGALPSETFASFADDGTLASILHFPEGFSVLAIDGAQAHASVSEKTTIDLSPNKHMLAFTETMPGTEARSIVLNRANKNQTVLGTGFSPFFIDDTHVLWFSSEGVMLTELASGMVSILEKTSAKAQPSPVLSPGGTHVAWMASDGRLELRRLEGGTLVPAATYPDAPPGASLELGTAGLYVLSSTDTGIEVRRYPLEQGESKRIYTFEPEWNILQLIL